MQDLPAGARPPADAASAPVPTAGWESPRETPRARSHDDDRDDLPDGLPAARRSRRQPCPRKPRHRPSPDYCRQIRATGAAAIRSEEHTSELQSLMRISYAVFCLKKKKTTNKHREKP